MPNALLNNEQDIEDFARGNDFMSANGGGPRVLMVTPRSPLAQGGVERHVMEVSRRMAAGGVRVEVLCTDPELKKATSETRDGVRIRTVRAWPRGRDW